MRELEEKILKCLEENARYSNSDIAKIVGSNEKEVSGIIEELENSGVILKYGAVINRTEDTKKVSAVIEVKVTPQAMYGFDKTAETLCQYSEIKSMYLMSGTYDLLLFIEADSLLAVSNFVSEKLSLIDGITGCATHFVLKNYKVDGAIALKSTEVEREIGL